MRNYRKGGKRNWFIHFRDETADCNFEPGEVPDDFKVISAYIYDPGEVTHCCSFSASSYVIQVAQFFVPPSPEAWEAWRDEGNGQDELLTEIESCFDYHGYFPAMDESDGIDSGIRVTRDKDGETNSNEAADEAREAESCNSWISGLYHDWLNRKEPVAA